MHTKKRKFFRHMFAFLMLIMAFCITGCCSKYNYYIYMDNTENALLKKNYKKARNLVAYAYRIENLNKTNDNFDKKAWLFYRLGVIAELQGDLDTAKGYYWGDSFDEGYYNKEPKIAWLAQTGWTNIDKGNRARTLEEILDLEAKEPPKKEVKKEKKTVKRKAKKKPAYVPQQRNFENEDGLIPPDPNADFIFQVYH